MAIRALALVGVLGLCARTAPAELHAEQPVLRVCADPNNLPFSNARGEGLENALASLIAEALGRRVRYTWWPQRRGFVRSTLAAGRCDVVMGMPVGSAHVLTTSAYYRSSYVFVTRRGAAGPIRSFDDPRLARERVGVHVIGDDYASLPPVVALSARRLVANVRGYRIYGDYARPDPPRALIDAVAEGEIDVAIAWGPLAGYFAPRAAVPLEIAPVEITPRDAADPRARMRFDIALAVRPTDRALRAPLERVLARERAAIDALLARFGVPRVPD